MTRRTGGPVRETGIVMERTDYNHYVGVQVAAPHIGRHLQPGQFVSVPAPPGSGPPGRWMLSPAAVRHADDADVLRLVARRSDRDPGVLGRLGPGDRLSLIGPLGTALKLPEVDGVTVLLGVEHGAAAAGLVADAMSAAGQRVHAHAFVAEPVGEHASPWLEPRTPELIRVEAIPDRRQWGTRVKQLTAVAEQVVIAAPGPLAREAASICGSQTIPSWVFMEPFMACGIGLCLTCAVPRAEDDGYARACTDGPAFPSQHVDWRKITPLERPT
ncbi:iron-sulfur cluster-binding protein [Streptomyces sp. DW26H14]|uniref:iron-sulfur cluster-binding protein n=1 Tax=Streptomyces sp. DW26H14 TaxID=3435395 RepID=UPI00403E1DCD